MALLAIVIVIGGGVLLASAVATAIALGRAEERHAQGGRAPRRDHLAASILCQLLVTGGAGTEDALRGVRKQGLGAPVTRDIDVYTWGSRYAEISTEQQRESLLDVVVKAIVEETRTIPLLQYSMLLDLTFSLGFRTDALYRLRDRYGFQFIDFARNGRAREADRAGDATPLFKRTSEVERQELLLVLEIEGKPTRQEIVTAYRRLAGRHHPDRVFGKSPEAEAEAAKTFIELTRVYERLLALHHDS